VRGCSTAGAGCASCCTGHPSPPLQLQAAPTASLRLLPRLWFFRLVAEAGKPYCGDSANRWLPSPALDPARILRGSGGATPTSSRPHPTFGGRSVQQRWWPRFGGSDRHDRSSSCTGLSITPLPPSSSFVLHAAVCGSHFILFCWRPPTFSEAAARVPESPPRTTGAVPCHH